MQKILPIYQRHCPYVQFIAPVRFEDDKLIYEKQYLGAERRSITEYETPFTALRLH
ncbi:hypothetical protein [Pectobacterium aroidearum]|uniref:hypothetical protein n=1 Tax=Pectobacterium aroidearum TaxID=1201031 RepID=UPI0015E00844|nr:hypothetical protein [Pectobacterium aroidearum]MBA0206205.1 hypothetical protein [Pectobacterium aroidearum]